MPGDTFFAVTAIARYIKFLTMPPLTIRLS